MIRDPASESAIDQAARRLERAIALLEQRLGAAKGRAGLEAGGLFDQDRAKLADERGRRPAPGKRPWRRPARRPPPPLGGPSPRFARSSRLTRRLTSKRQPSRRTSRSSTSSRPLTPKPPTPWSGRT